MLERRLLLLSNSKNYGERYLEHAEGAIKSFLGKKITKVLFIPFAAVRTSFDDYATTVRSRFQEIGYRLDSIHQAGDLKDAVNNAEAIVIGGGNNFHLFHSLSKAGIPDAARARIHASHPDNGW